MVVRLGRRGQDGEVGVAEQRAVGVARVDGVPGGEQHQPADLGHGVGRQPRPGEQGVGERRAVPLVGVALGARVVDRVVAPGREAHQVRPRGGRRVRVDHVEDGGQVGDRVVVPVRFPPARQQLRPGTVPPRRVGRPGAPGRRPPPVEKVEHAAESAAPPPTGRIHPPRCG
ncbi:MULTISPECIES: hypothetical protein [unclassified Micromonospora]|uniref:hypothetical protein n=1 Tax=unclassified Micromonospora TaxID=2617518 RepID=UPI00331DC015